MLCTTPSHSPNRLWRHLSLNLGEGAARISKALASRSSGYLAMRARYPASLVSAVDIHPLAFGEAGFVPGGLGGELGGTRGVQPSRLRHSPVGDPAIRIESGRLPKRTFRLTEPKSMKLTNTLLNEFLNEWIVRRNSETDVPVPPHQVSPLPWPLIKLFAVVRMTGKQALIAPCGTATGGENAAQDQDVDQAFRHQILLHLQSLRRLRDKQGIKGEQASQAQTFEDSRRMPRIGEQASDSRHPICKESSTRSSHWESFGCGPLTNDVATVCAR